MKRLFIFFIFITSYSLCYSQTKTINGHEYVDLGLSVKWATCNIGAYSPEESGDYYAWGDTITKVDYSWANYFDSADSKGEIFYTYFSSTFSRKGLTRIDPNSGRDIARKDWGGTWRLPTRSEMEELMNRCTWIWDEINGQNGFVVKGPSGNSIFLPASGCIDGTTRHIYNRHGLYQTSDLYYQQYEASLYFIKESKSIGNSSRCSGLVVRAVSY